MEVPIILGVFAFLIISTFIFFAWRYKRCPSDRVLVVYGRVKGGKSAKCVHGGGTLVLPLIQDYSYLKLTPLTINIPLTNALSQQNIRIDVPSTFTVGISTLPHIMTNAAERLLGLPQREIEEMAREIIFGQLRLTVASLTIEEINQDRERFLEAIRNNVEPELNKIGLVLINVNITDITDESDYISSIGKKAAAEAINKARIDVAEQNKIGAIGEAAAVREKQIRVAEETAKSEKGEKAAEADQRIYVQQQEASAIEGENNAKAEIARTNAELDIQVAVNDANAEKGRKQAEADQRVYVEQQEATAIEGENIAKANIAAANASLAVKEAEAFREGEVAKRQAEVAIQQAEAKAEHERLMAAEVVQKEIEKQKIEIAAAAAAQKERLEAQGTADAILAKYTAEAEGVRKVLDAKAAGYNELVRSCGNDARSAATLLLVEKMEDIVGKQVEAIQNLKIDKITVWDSGNSENANGNGSTANFLSGMVKSLPPLHELAGMAGVELPGFLGSMQNDETKTIDNAKATEAKPVKKLPPKTEDDPTEK